MKFADVKNALSSLNKRLSNTTGRSHIQEITVDEPEDGKDELAFFKLVLWCYVAINEAGQPTLKYLYGLLRARDSESTARASRIREDILDLRTARAHNLPPGESSNEHKRRQAQVWLLQKGGEPPDWSRCFEHLCQEMLEYIGLLKDVWSRAVANEVDRASVVKQLLILIEGVWPAQDFDRLIEAEARSLGIDGLNCVKFREANLDRWRQLTTLFQDPESARSAMRAVIHNELRAQFVMN